MSEAAPRETSLAKVRRRVSWLVRDRWPSRRVVRDVQGVRLVLPWAHRLPDYARSSPDYGQNLPALAAALVAADETPFTMLDIGANVGDSAVQVLHAAPGEVLCVEADPFYLDFLHRNVDEDPRIVVEEALISVDEVADADLAPVRSGGTTRFAAVQGERSTPVLAVSELRSRHPRFDRLRLVKSDTDGYDVVLVPAAARVWAASTPVLFLEYDPVLTRVAGHEAASLWPVLAELGYTDVGVWDNGGQPVGLWSVEEMARTGDDRLASAVAEGSYQYWDVAVVHGADAAGSAALRTLFT